MDKPNTILQSRQTKGLSMLKKIAFILLSVGALVSCNQRASEGGDYKQAAGSEVLEIPHYV